MTHDATDDEHGVSRTAAPSALIGRDVLLAQCEALVRGGARLLTLRGTVGAGKARLARELASRLEAGGRVRQTQRWTLAGVAASDVRSLLDDAWSAAGDGSLLVLERCEHARVEVARWIDERPASDAIVVITSRARVGVPDEHVVAVEPLSEADAVELFLRLSEATRGASTSRDASPLDPARLHEATALVRRLGCLPLALELAAAQTHALSIGELLSRSDGLLDLLASPRAAAAEPTLRSAFEGSLRDLDRDTRRVLDACSTFEGRFLLSDAEVVADGAAPSVAAALARLLDCSLVRARENDGGTSFELHPPVRALVRESLGKRRAALERAWSEHVLRCMATLVATLHTPHVATSLERLRGDLARLARAPSGDDPGEIAAQGLAILALSRGPVHEAISAVDAALERVGRDRTAVEDTALRARLHHLRGVLHGRAGDVARAHRDLADAASLATSAGDTTRTARIEVDLGDLHRHAGPPETARACYERALDAHRAAGDRIGEARALGSLAALEHERGELERAAELYRRVDVVTDELVRAGGDASALTAVQHNRGVLLAETGDLTGAERCFQLALAQHRSSGNRRFEGIAEHDLACLAMQRREPRAARARLVRSAAIAREVGDRREEGIAHALLGVCAAMLGAVDEAETWLESASATLHHVGEPSLLAALATHRAHLAIAALRRSRQLGEPLPHALVEEVRRALSERTPHSELGDEARFATRLLAAEADDALRSDRAIVAPDGAWFSTPSAGRVDLAGRSTLRRLLEALALAHRDGPTELEPAALLRAGWPGARALTPSAKNRLHVAIATLRKLGLGEALERRGAGYSLAAEVELAAPATD